MAAATGKPTRLSNTIAVIVEEILREARPGDHVLVMSNGGFGDIHAKLIEGLQARFS